jgi:hypothetical protein
VIPEPFCGRICSILVFRARLELVNGDPGEFNVRLPFRDKRERRRRDEFFRKLALKRKGDAIVCELPVPAAVRDRAANFALTHPAWTSSPIERDPNYFRAWQRVSLTLQSFLRAFHCRGVFLGPPALRRSGNGLL